MKVLIIDDSKVVQERLVTMFFELEGVEVIGQAENPAEAIEAVQKLKPDAVILDIRMPGGNGIDVLQRIKKEEPCPLVVVLTNYPYPQYRKKCMNLGADFFFDKSIEFEKVAEVFRNLITGSQTK